MNSEGPNNVVATNPWILWGHPTSENEWPLEEAPENFSFYNHGRGHSVAHES